MSELVDRAKVILSRELNVDVSALLPDRRLREDLGMDSIIALNLIFAAERELDVVIKEEEVVALVTVQDLERLVDRFSDQM
jgi:acyl carrier protein